MSDRGLRGTRLGANSFESDVNVELAERRRTEYRCPMDHVTIVPFSVEADIPALWECRCGREALIVDGTRPEDKPTKPARTHWDMLLERRSVADLEVLLNERLELLRSGRLHQRRSA